MKTLPDSESERGRERKSEIWGRRERRRGRERGREGGRGREGEGGREGEKDLCSAPNSILAPEWSCLHNRKLHTHTYTYTHVYIHTYAHMCVHTHTRTEPPWTGFESICIISFQLNCGRLHNLGLAKSPVLAVKLEATICWLIEFFLHPTPHYHRPRQNRHNTPENVQ